MCRWFRYGHIIINMAVFHRLKPWAKLVDRQREIVCFVLTNHLPNGGFLKWGYPKMDGKSYKVVPPQL